MSRRNPNARKTLACNATATTTTTTTNNAAMPADASVSAEIFPDNGNNRTRRANKCNSDEQKAIDAAYVAQYLAEEEIRRAAMPTAQTPPEKPDVVLPDCDIFDKSNYYVSDKWIPFLTPVDPLAARPTLCWIVEAPGMSEESINFAKDSQRAWILQNRDDKKSPPETRKYSNHDHVYDYSHVVYRGSNEDVIIRCVVHDRFFKQKPCNHKKPYSGCDECRFDQLAQIRRCHLEHNKTRVRYQYYTCPGTLRSANDKIIMHCNDDDVARPFGLKLDSHVRNISGCKDCTNKKRREKSVNSKIGENGENSLLAVFPNIAVELAPVNGQPTADKLTSKSNQKVLWKCPKTDNTHPNYLLSVNKRTHNGQGCPMCTKSVVSPEYNFLIEKDVSEWWDFEKNTNAQPEKLMPNTRRFKCWFLCTTCRDIDGNQVRHSYEAYPNNFTSGERCPFFAGKMVDHTNSFAVYCPIMSAFWDPAANEGVTPDTVSYGSGKKCHFRCNICNNRWVNTPNITFKQFGGWRILR